MLPNVFQGTSFKKHNPLLLNERSLQEFSTLFLFLASTTDRKKEINQFVENASFHSIDCRYDGFKKYSRNQIDFRLQDLDLSDLKRRVAAREIIVNFFKDAVHVSNSNLVRYSSTLMLKECAKISAEEDLQWIGKSRKLNQGRFKYTY